MKQRRMIYLRWSVFVGLIAFIGGCTTDATSADAILQNVQTFFIDFARQIMTALLL